MVGVIAAVPATVGVPAIVGASVTATVPASVRQTEPSHCGGSDSINEDINPTR
jgi:hypothetical protein